MYFPKLELLNKYKNINEYIIKKFDAWLASQPDMYIDYLNPLDFIEDCKIKRKLGLIIFSLAANEEFFKEHKENPLLKIKYIVNCPTCDNHFKTYNNKTDIPKKFVNCIENCEPFNPILYPERIEIYYELLDESIIEDDKLLEVYEKTPCPPLTYDIAEEIWEEEESDF